jgi:hypothetical protein
VAEIFEILNTLAGTVNGKLEVVSETRSHILARVDFEGVYGEPYSYGFSLSKACFKMWPGDVERDIHAAFMKHIRGLT